MPSALDPPAARGYEDSATRFEDYNVGGQNFIRRLNKKTYTLIDGPNSGNTVTYWAQEVQTSGVPGGGPAINVAGTDTPADGHANPTTAIIVSAWPEIRDNGATTSSQMRAGSPTADPGNVGVLAAQMHVSTNVNTVRVLSPSSIVDNAALGNSISVGGFGFNGGGWDRLRTSLPAGSVGNTGVLATGLHLSDGTNIQKWLTAIAQVDGVNGNNMAAEVPWVFNGTTFDRLRSDAVTTGALKVSTGAPLRGALTDRSGTIAAGGTAQSLAASNTSRSFIQIQNQSNGDLFINFTTTAVVTGQPSIKIASGSTFELGAAPGFVSTEAISIIGATTGQAFAAKEG